MVHRRQRDGWAAPWHPNTVQAGPTGPPTYPRYQRGRMQGAALGNEQAGHCNWRTGGGSMRQRNTVYPLAAPPRVVREEELAGRVLAVKGAIRDL